MYCSPSSSLIPQPVLVSCWQIVLKKKAVDDIMGGDDAWANVDKTQVGLSFSALDPTARSA